MNISIKWIVNLLVTMKVIRSHGIQTKVYIPVNLQMMSTKDKSLPATNNSRELFTIVDQEPYSVTLKFQLAKVHENVAIKVLYERVPYHYDAEVAILDTPVMNTFTVAANVTTHNYTIKEVPKGKYIICAQQMKQVEDEFQCLEVIIEKYSGHSKRYKPRGLKVAKEDLRSIGLMVDRLNGH